MRKVSAFLAALLAVVALPLAAQEIAYQEIIETVEVAPEQGTERFVQPAPAPAPMPTIPSGIARYGPFRVLDASHVALVDATGPRAPAQFAAMMRAFPGITTIEMIECPGTEDDRANLQLGRMIHDRGIVTHVPAGGSVRSGGVELFLAGSLRIADEGSEFAVHSWADDQGKEAKDYPASAPENRAYIDYYRAMGLEDAQARAFYDMTNSVPNADARWLTRQEMAQWVRLDTVDLPKDYLASQTLDSRVAVN